jgi:hypothetical protein
MRRLFHPLLIAILVVLAPRFALAEPLCEVGEIAEAPGVVLVWNTWMTIRLANDLEENVLATITPVNDPKRRHPAWLPDAARRTVKNWTDSIAYMNTGPIWVSEAPFLGLTPIEGGFSIFLAQPEGRNVLYETRTLEWNGGLSKIFMYFLNRTLADCSAGAPQPSYFVWRNSSLARFLSDHCVANPKSREHLDICSKDFLQREIGWLDERYHAVILKIGSMLNEMNAREAQDTARYLELWSSDLAQIKAMWCDVYQDSNATCLN